MDNNYITTQETPRSHFTMIPNIVDDSGLDPYSFRLYAHLRRVAGETGECWQSTETLAEACKMSTGKVSECKGILEGAGLIVIRECSGAGGRYHNIVIVDIWAENAARYASVHSANANGESVHTVKAERSLSETKKNPLKKNSHQEKQMSPPTAADANAPASLSRWLELVRDGKNRSAVLRSMIETLYPYLTEQDLPDYGYIGKVARKTGGAGLLAEKLWMASVYQPQGDILAYVQAMNGNGANKGGNGSAILKKPPAEPVGDLDAKRAAFRKHQAWRQACRDAREAGLPEPPQEEFYAQAEIDAAFAREGQ